ncbi:MAG: hypothetical protein ABIW76_20255 [Fibrobacteria bacterium]
MNNRVIAFGLFALAVAFGEGKRDLSLFTAIDFGRLENGYDMIKKYDPSGLALNRTYVNVGFNEELEGNYLLSVGVGGIFWKAFEGDGGGPADKVIKFGPGISNAFMKWSPSEQWNLTFGYFPYRYNEAARNLGEYLFRSEAYPTIIYTGGWSWMNDIGYNTVGAKLTWNLAEGRFRQDLGLFGEYFNSPIYDITPAYIATFKPIKGLTYGGAVSLHRFISPTPKVKQELTKSYVYYENFYFPAVAADSAVGVTGSPEQRVTMLKSDIDLKIGQLGGDSATYYGNANNAGKRPQTVAFDLAAVMAMAFFELDFNGLLGLDESALGKFNLYGEVAQLGFKNYPIFYTDMAQRRPVMLGASLPTFGLLKHLSFELEYLQNPNIESIASTYDKLDLPPDENFRYRVFTRDDYKWSINAARSFSEFLSIHVQVANDHIRLKDGFARPQYIPVTQEPGHWYWLTRIQWMI